MANSALYDALYADVIELTKHPELPVETKIAIQEATLLLHGANPWAKDLSETIVLFQEGEQFFQRFYLETLSRWRSFQYLRTYDPSSLDPETGLIGRAGPFFDPIPPDKVLDSYGYTHDRRYYVAGNVVNLYSKTKFDRILIGYYARPNITLEGYTSWIAEEWPPLIAIRAAQNILDDVGEEASAKRLEKRFGILYQTFERNQLEIQYR